MRFLFFAKNGGNWLVLVAGGFGRWGGCYVMSPLPAKKRRGFTPKISQRLSIFPKKSHEHRPRHLGRIICGSMLCVRFVPHFIWPKSTLISDTAIDDGGIHVEVVVKQYDIGEESGFKPSPVKKFQRHGGGK